MAAAQAHLRQVSRRRRDRNPDSERMMDELLPANGTRIAADEDADSALEVPLSESLASLRSSIFAYQEENGRTYHAMSAGKYFMPNDEKEIERLDLQHHVMTLTIGGRHCLCPKNDGAARVLDLGTGTGIWAIEYADAHPEAEVIGVDLSPGQPTFVPPNCSFEIDDLEKEWTWSKTFDFIFCRMTTGSFADNFNIVENAFNQLQPGGYFEAQDIGHLRCDDGTLSETSDLLRWMTLIQEGLEKLGRSTTAAEERKSTMEAVGFEGVVETVYKWPTNHWPRDKKYKDLGKWSLINTDYALEAAALAPLTRGLGWSREEVLALVARARKALRDTTVHAYWPVYVVYGCKPVSLSDPTAVSPLTSPSAEG
ncbi:S-adenosyl-L-methionine-dependent methyltransferase [Fusarium solani]|uniref:S-adenosyl-L-methionine-dependent methyltransferase n=1 Tax=Fusarium solani TaxID=169388 RepID=A0A9P9GQZ6_FUSSL|nr:S-adenosyl-L-methionine-dependent methyltransferase [Fusarium solani]KAH7243895.1 S-adenosyl-L-methionine-dependent methyltransferase [Fusarium solani]